MCQKEVNAPKYQDYGSSQSCVLISQGSLWPSIWETKGWSHVLVEILKIEMKLSVWLFWGKCLMVFPAFLLFCTSSCAPASHSSWALPLPRGRSRKHTNPNQLAFSVWNPASHWKGKRNWVVGMWGLPPSLVSYKLAVVSQGFFLFCQGDLSPSCCPLRNICSWDSCHCVNGFASTVPQPEVAAEMAWSLPRYLDFKAGWGCWESHPSPKEETWRSLRIHILEIGASCI